MNQYIFTNDSNIQVINIYKTAVKRAFTLAEVLVTLAIIGVVAALTIPSLMSRLNESTYKSAWKKIYSEISLANMNVVNDAGGSLSGLWQTDSSASMNSQLNMYGNYLSFIKRCNADAAASSPDTTDKCWHSTSGSLIAHKKDGAIIIGSYGHASGAILNNGALILFYGYKGFSAPNDYTSILVDVNGYKGPNIVGTDIFRIHVLDNHIEPFGANDSYSPETDCISTGSGYGCSTYYLTQ